MEKKFQPSRVVRFAHGANANTAQLLNDGIVQGDLANHWGRFTLS
jgi:hypothetical protein